VKKSDVDEELRKDGEFSEKYRRWLASKTAAAVTDEDTLLGRFDTLERLKSAVMEYATHLGNYDVVIGQLKKDRWRIENLWSTPLDDLRGVIAGQLPLLRESRLLKAYAPLDQLDAIIDKLELLGPEEYDRRYFAAARERGLPLGDELRIFDFTKGFTLRRTVCMRVGSGANRNSLHAVVHEFIHALSSPATHLTFGPALDEGMTETIARMVIEEVMPSLDAHATRYWQPSATAYQRERKLVGELADEIATPTALQDLIKLYFDPMFARVPEAAAALAKFRTRLAAGYADVIKI
jgi:hypothetical protein